MRKRKNDDCFQNIFVKPPLSLYCKKLDKKNFKTSFYSIELNKKLPAVLSTLYLVGFMYWLFLICLNVKCNCLSHYVVTSDVNLQRRLDCILRTLFRR